MKNTAMPLERDALDQLFKHARTYSHWQNRPVSDEILHQLYDLLKQGPTSANCSPGRFVFVRSQEAKALLSPSLAEGNVAKTLQAPVTVIVAQDREFYRYLSRLFPHTDAQSWFIGNEALIRATAMRNSALQGAYLLMAARALGLDCGPMSGFDAERLNAAFFPNSTWEVNFLINLGYGEDSQLHARHPRFEFDEVCRLQ